MRFEWLVAPAAREKATSSPKQLKGFPEHAALRADIEEFLARTAKHLEGVKLIRDLMIAHWDGKNHHGFVVKQANTNIDLIGEFLVEAEVLRERVAALAGVRYKRVVREDIEASVMEVLMRTWQVARADPKFLRPSIVFTEALARKPGLSRC